jgi:signal transduction histidine kinase
VPLTIIIVSAITLAFLAYFYSLSVSNAVGEIATNNIRSNAAVQANDFSLVLGNGFDIISTNLEILSSMRAVQNSDSDAVRLFEISQNSTNHLTDYYMLLDHEGRIEWTTYSADAALDVGSDRSQKEYFSVPLITKRPFFSDIIISTDEIPRRYIAYPILDRQRLSSETIHEDGGIVQGVAVAAIGLNNVGNLLRQGSSFEAIRNMLFILDNNGVVIFAPDSRLIGKSIYTDRDEMISIGVLSPATLDEFSDSQRQTEGGKPYLADFSDATGKITTIASAPVVLDGHRVSSVYVVAAHELTSEVAVLFDEQNLFSILLVLVLGLLASGVLFFILSLNRRLELQVEGRTYELKKVNRALDDSNKKLGHLNEQLIMANESLQASHRLQKEFINIASHEMRTPTQAILLHSDIVRRKPLEAGQSIEAIVRNAERLQRLTNNILEVSRIETQGLKLKKERVDLGSVISLVIHDLKDQHKDAIRFIYEPSQLMAEADKSGITQVLSNLIANAIEFTKGTIEVSALEDPSGDAIIVKVTDDGPGIDPEIIPRLFTKFATKSDKGTGLGLFIAKSIVDAHGGKIWFEPNASGKGTTFALRLPTGT